MSAQWLSPLYTDGDFTVAKPCSLPEFASPIPATTDQYVFRQDFCQFLANFSPTALNTAHPSSGATPDYSTFLLVNEGDRRDIGGGICRWTRTYAKKPASWIDPETFAYSFIGTAISLPDGTIVFRNPQVGVVQTKLFYDYFLIAPSGGDYTDALLIPVIRAMRYVYQATIGGAIYGGITMLTTQLNPSNATVMTWPSSDQYQAMVSYAQSNGWADIGTASITISNAAGSASYSIKAKTNVVIFPTDTLAGGPPPSSGHMAGVIDTASSDLGAQIPVEDSKITRWNGNIYQRVTRYALAQ